MAELTVSQVLKLAANAALGLPLEADFRRNLTDIKASESADQHRFLAQHRLQYLVWDALKNNQLEYLVPEAYAHSLVSEAQSALLRNAMFELALTRTTEALAAQNIRVMVCKGAVLAQHYYPARGQRRMQDIDYWLLGDDLIEARAILGQIGFRERPEKALSDSHNFINEVGIVLDVHTRMDLFETRGRRLSDLCAPQPDAAYQVLMPEALVAHLLVHLLGHAAKTGILLCWIFDLALVLRRHRIRVEELRALLPRDGSWDVFLRLLKTFLIMGWTNDALGLEDEMQPVRVISWPSVVRQRRRCAWRGLRGKARLLRALARGDGRVENIPTITDLVMMPVDWLYEESEILAGQGALLIPRAHI